MAMMTRQYSDESEGSELREFVDGEIDEEESPSPRTALLSPVSNRSNMLVDRPRRFRRGPSERYRRERERAHSGVRTSELLRLLVNQEYETQQTQKVLYNAFDKLQSESRRASEAEERALDVSQRFRSINEARVAAMQDAARSNEELRLYKLQLENAQTEINRAQDILRVVEAQRDEAEASAARARTTARRLNEERLVTVAREEGRRLGFEEGVRRGRELGYYEGRNAGYDDGQANMRDVASRAIDRVLHEDGEYDEDQDDDDADPLPTRLLAYSPEVVRAPTPPNSALTGGGMMRPGAGPPGGDVFDADDRRRRDRGLAMPQPEPGSSTVVPTVVPPPGVVNSSSSSDVPPPVPAKTPRSVPTSWPSGSREQLRRPPSRYSDTSSAVPPDNYVPAVNPDNSISLPSPYEFQRAASAQSTLANNPEPPYTSNSFRPPSSPHSPSMPLPVDISATDTESASTRYGRGRGRQTNNTRAPPFVARDYALPGMVPSADSAASDPPARRSSPESQGSTTISQLDLVSFPATSSGGRQGGRDRSRGLSVIHEDSGSQTTPSAPQSRGHSLHSERRVNTPQSHVPPPYDTSVDGGGSPMGMSGGPRDSGYGEPSGRYRDMGMDVASQRDRERLANQRIADELRYSDPSKVDEWRRSGAAETRSSSTRDGPPRRRPTNLSTPAPLSPQPPSVDLGSNHQRARSMTSQSELSRTGTGTPFRPGHRRAASSNDSSVPEITIQPPSGPPSDVPDHRASMGGASDLLSPEHANRPLPVPAPVLPNRSVSPTPTVPTTPLVRPPPLIGGPPESQLPLGFVASGPPLADPTHSSGTRFGSPFSGGGVPLPSSATSVPTDLSNNAFGNFSFPQHGASGSSQPPYPFPRTNPSPAPTDGRTNSNSADPNASRQSNGASRPSYNRTRTRSSGSATHSNPRTSYAAAPVPAGVQYPDPPSLSTPGNPAQKVPLPVSRVGSPGGSSVSRRSHTRSQSLHAGVTPAALNRSLPGAAKEPSGVLRRTGSNASMASNRSHSRFDPQTYLDPAFFVDEDAVARNTAANATTSVPRTPRMSTVASPALSYLTVPNM